MSRQTEDILFGKLTGELPLYDDFTRDAQRRDDIHTMEQRRAEAEANRNPAEAWRNDCFAYVDEKVRDIDANRISEGAYPQGRGLKALLKRVLRRLFGWYVDPTFAHQTDFNNAVTPAIGRMQEMHKHTSDRVRGVEDRLSAAETVLSGLDADRMRLLSEERAFRERLETLSGIRVNAAEQKISMFGTELTQFREESEQRLSGLEEQGTAAGEQLRELSAELAERTRENTELRRELEALRDELSGQNVLLAEQLKSMSAELISFNETAELLRLHGDTPRDERLTASQSGEDSIAEYVFRVLGIPPEKRTYLDLGANHAVELSNTWRFYRQGARGVLVEANPALIGELKFYRGEDVILNCCVTPEDEGATVDFYVMNGDGLSTCDREQAEHDMAQNPALSVERVVSVPTRTLTGILEQYFDTAPAFLNVDLEGSELEILRSVDWERWRPLMISVESIPYRSHLVVEERENDTVDFLKEHDYTEYAFTGINTLMLDRRQLSSEVLK